jgi:hypothetical protein
MKRILLAIVILTASWHTATAQAITRSAFTTKVDQMDAYIGTGDLTSANATMTELQSMMKTAMHDNKGNAASATTDADRTAYSAACQNEGIAYNQVWKLRTDLATNRAAIHAKLETFAATLP